MKINTIKNLTIVVALLAVLAFAASCTSDGSRVATVNGTNIYERDIAFLLHDAQELLMMEYMMLHGPIVDHDRPFHGGITFGRAIREEAVRNAAFIVIVEEFAAEHGITISDENIEHVEDGINFMMAEFGGANALQMMLHMERVDGIDHLREIFMGQQLVDAVIMAVLDDPALFAAFEHLYIGEVDYVVEHDLVGAKHILASFQHFIDAEETEIFAQYILDRILAGDDFVELMHMYSQDGGLFMFPDGYTFGPNEMVPEFEAATRELEIGEISGLVEAFHGFHIIKRIEPDPLVWKMMNDIRVLTDQDRMVQAIILGFEEMLDNADIRHFRALDNVELEP